MCYVFEKHYTIGKVTGKNTRVSSHSLLQGIFLSQESNLGLPHSRQIPYHLSHQVKPRGAKVKPLIVV